MVYAAAADTDFDDVPPNLTRLRHRLIYRYGVAKADRIVVQSERQQRALPRELRAIGGSDQQLLRAPWQTRPA